MPERAIPIDRRVALANGRDFPDRQVGAALFADVSGFSSLAETLERALGAERGAEELTAIIDRTFHAVVAVVHSYGGSVVSFAGDALNCWFDGDDGRRAVAAGAEIQQELARQGAAVVPRVGPVVVSLKVSVAAGEVRRFRVGDPRIQLLDCQAGELMDRVVAGEHVCRPGELIVEESLAARLGSALDVAERGRVSEGSRFAVVRSARGVARRPWPENLPPIADAVAREWVLPPIYDRLRAGQERFLAEFRPVAALFLNFGGIDYDRDPAAGAKLDDLVRWVMEVLERHGGYLLHVSSGDKGSYALAVFGAPVAHGDDVRRAAAAAEELRHPPARFPYLGQLRIGLNAGRVYAGLYAGRRRQAYHVHGDAVNLAARMMQLAAPGQVVMPATVGAALDRRFAVRALEPVMVKGRDTPVPICELLGPADRAVDLSEPRYPLPLVGRRRELGQVEAAVTAARGGRGRVVGLAGDPGMGKSRLVSEAIGRATAAGFACFAGECQAHGTASAYMVWRPIWRGILGLPRDAPAAEQVARAEAALAHLPAEARALLPLLGPLLDLPIPENDATGPIPSVARKGIVEQLLGGILRGRAATGPVCLVLEDCHWIDALSSDLLAVLSRSIADLPVLIVLAYRTADLEATNLKLGQVEGLVEVPVTELGPEEARRLAVLLSSHFFPDGRAPSSALLDLVAERAQGNPFYVEELLRYFRDRGLDVADPDAFRHIELPTSLQSLVLSRIDRLVGSTQRALRLASVIGRRFVVEWCAGAFRAELDPEAARRDYAVLGETGLTVPDTPEPELAYLFRHAVTREVAYENLTFTLRQQLHGQLGDYLEALFAESPPVDLLAYHYARSADRAKEARYRHMAAELAIRNGAYADAHEHVRRALEIVRAQEDAPQRAAQELELTLLLGSILLVVRGQGAPEAKDAYDRARELSRRVAPGPTLGRAIFGLWTYYLFQGLMHQAQELADEALTLGRMSGDRTTRIMSHLAVSQTAIWNGKLADSVEHMERVFDLYEPAEHSRYITQFAQNPRFTAASGGQWALWGLGRPDESRRVTDQAIAEARELGHDFTYVIAYLGRPTLAFNQRLEDELAATIGEFAARAQRAGNPFYIAFALALDGWVKIGAGREAEGLEQLFAQRATMRAIGSKLIDPFMTAMVAEACLRTGRLAEGLDVIAADFDAFVANGAISYAPEHLRLRGELLLAVDQGRADDAEVDLRAALRLAREQGARTFELRSALGLARLLARRARAHEGREILAPIVGWFTQGLDAPDVVAARALLQEMEVHR